MKDTEIIVALKSKRQDHLADISRLKHLVESIDELIAEYSADRQEVTDRNLPLEVLGGPVRPNLAGLNLTQAISEVMRTRPDYEWRGSEIHKVLLKNGFSLNNLGQKISARLIERSKAGSGRWVRIETDRGHPKYRLKEKYRRAQ